MRLPKKTDEDKAKRNAAIQEAVLGAINIPHSTLNLCPEILKLAEYVLKNGNQNALSDAAVAVKQSQAGAWGAYYNVLINLPSLDDLKKRKEIKKAAKTTLDKLEQKAAELTLYAEETLSNESS